MIKTIAKCGAMVKYVGFPNCPAGHVAIGKVYRVESFYPYGKYGGKVTIRNEAGKLAEYSVRGFELVGDNEQETGSDKQPSRLDHGGSSH